MHTSCSEELITGDQAVPMASRTGELRMEPRPAAPAPAPALMRHGGAGLCEGAWPDMDDGRGLVCEGRGLAAALTAAPPGGRQDGGGAVKMAAPRGPRRHGLRCATRRDTTRHDTTPTASVSPQKASSWPSSSSTASSSAATCGEKNTDGPTRVSRGVPSGAGRRRPVPGGRGQGLFCIYSTARIGREFQKVIYKVNVNAGREEGTEPNRTGSA